MKPYDQLILCEKLIRQFEYRTDNDAYNNILFITRDVRNALITANKLADIDKSLSGRYSSAANYRGAKTKDLFILTQFDNYKKDLLHYIKEAKEILAEIETDDGKKVTFSGAERE